MGVGNEATGVSKLNNTPDHNGLEILPAMFVYQIILKIRDEKELQ